MLRRTHADDDDDDDNDDDHSNNNDDDIDGDDDNDDDVAAEAWLVASPASLASPGLPGMPLPLKGLRRHKSQWTQV